MTEHCKTLPINAHFNLGSGDHDPNCLLPRPLQSAVYPPETTAFGHCEQFGAEQISSALLLVSQGRLLLLLIYGRGGGALFFTHRCSLETEPWGVYANETGNQQIAV